MCPWAKIMPEATCAATPSPKTTFQPLSPTRDFDLLDGLGGVVGDMDIDVEGLPVVIQLLKGGGVKLIGCFQWSHYWYAPHTDTLLGLLSLNPSPQQLSIAI